MKTIIAPLLGFIFVGLKLFFHIELPEELQNSITSWVVNGVALAAILVGIIKNHFKPKK